MSYQTLRDKNYCLSCDYEWYPRGKYRSNKCPNCGNRDVRMPQDYIVYYTPFRKKCRAVMMAACLGMWIGVVSKTPVFSGISLVTLALTGAAHSVAQRTETRYE